jgi:bacterioferritin
MKSDAKVLEYLNRVLKNEITAINQYFLHARMFQNWGFHALCEYEHKESVDEMSTPIRSSSASCSSKACRTSRTSASS